MRRGDVVLVRQPNTPAGKARPCVVVQRDSALDAPNKVTVCPLTSHVHGSAGQRPFVAPTPENGLRLPSEVEADWIYTYPIEVIGGVIGRLDKATIEKIDLSLRHWLEL
jgi:mRNA interferase MazF